MSGTLFDMQEPCPELHVKAERYKMLARLRTRDTKMQHDCLLCGRLVKLYARVLNSQMARFLCRLSRLTRENPGRRFFGVREIMPTRAHKASSDGSYLTFWGFVMEPAAPSSGQYAMTPDGEAFVNGDATATRTKFVFNKTVYAEDDKTTTIREALGEHFDYGELMGLARS